MDATGWGAIGTAAGAAVALGAMITTIWQARLAMRAASATEEQARLLRRQLDAQTADRDLRDAPSFALNAGQDQLGECTVEPDGSVKFTPLTKKIGVHPTLWVKQRSVEFRMTAGPERVLAEIELRHSFGEDVRLMQSGPYEIVRGAARRFTVVFAHRLEGRPLEVIIRCTERQGLQRRWINNQEIQL